MRKWHRWLVVFASVFMLWTAATGFVGQVISLAGGEHHDHRPPDAARAAAMPAAAGAPAPGAGDHGPGGDRHDGPPRDLYHFIIDLHSGNYFGTAGKMISVLVGAALFFFSVSGVWMYIDMFRKRKRIGRSGVFWD